MEAERRYVDILYKERPESPGHPRMPMLSRAAQFSPFAALTGYDDAIEEAARQTDLRPESDEENERQLEKHLQTLKKREKEKPRVRAVCFQADARKEGGARVTVRGRLKRLNEAEGRLLLEDGRRIDFADLLEIAADEPDIG